jgi:hypothetical protein
MNKEHQDLIKEIIFNAIDFSGDTLHETENICRELGIKFTNTVERFRMKCVEEYYNNKMEKTQ